MNLLSNLAVKVLLAVFVAILVWLWFPRWSGVKEISGEMNKPVSKLNSKLPNPTKDEAIIGRPPLHYLVGMTLGEALSSLGSSYSNCKLNDEPPGVVRVIRVGGLLGLPGVDGVDLILTESVFDRNRTWPFEMVKDIKVEEVVLHKK